MDRPVSRDVASPPTAAAFVGAALDTLDFGFAVFDSEFRLVACNAAFRALRPLVRWLNGALGLPAKTRRF